MIGIGLGIAFGGKVSVAAPTVSSLTPNYGLDAGGRNITIAGTNLSSVTAVTFGGVAGTIQSKTPTSMVVTTPATTAGALDVVVTNPGGSSVAKTFYSYNGVLQYTDPAVGVQLATTKISRIYESMVNDGSASTSLDFIMATGAWQPTYDATGLDNQPSIYYPTGPANLSMQTAASFSVGAMSWIWVCKAETTSALVLGTLTQGSDSSYCYNNLSNNDQIKRTIGETTSQKGGGARFVPADGAPHLVIWTYGGSNATNKLFIDGSEFTFASNTVANDPGTTANAGYLNLGSTAGIALPWRGWIGPNALVDHALSAGELAVWRAMFKARYPSLP